MQDEALFHEAARALIRRHHSLDRVRDVEAGGSSVALWPLLAEQGWIGLRLPEELGGMGLDGTAALGLVAAAAPALLPEPLVGAAIMPGALLAALEPTAAVAALGRAIADGSLVAALAWQEAPGQVDLQPVATELRPAGVGFRLSGVKWGVPGEAGQVLVSCRHGGELALVHVSRDAPGISVTTRPQADGSILADLIFEDVALSGDQVLARGGRLEAALDTAVAEGALACAVQLHGLAREAFDRTRTYLGQRSQFGQTLASFQALRHRVVELGLALELTKSAIEQATGLLAEPGRHRSLSVGAAKARASDAALLVTRWAVQLHGAMGYTAECDIGLFLKAALHWSAWMGNPDAHRRSWVEAGLLEDALS